MGRNKTRKKAISSNQRLRSDTSRPYTPNKVSYLSVTKPLYSPPKNKLVLPNFGPTIIYGKTPTVAVGFPNPNRTKSGQSTKINIRGSVVATTPEPSRYTEERKKMVCVDRAERREVLHATKKTGKTGQKSPIYNWKSKIHCKGGK